MTSSRLSFVVLVVAAAFVIAGLSAPAALARQTQPGETATLCADTGGRLHWKKGKKKKKKSATKKKSKKGKKGKKSKKGKNGSSAEPAVSDEDAAPAAEPTPDDAAPAKKAQPSRAERIGTERMAGAGAGGATPLRRSNRMEFDARVVRGETAGSGAVILFERGPRHLATLTQRRKVFLDATIEPVLGKAASATPRHKKPPSKAKKNKKNKDKKDKPN